MTPDLLAALLAARAARRPAVLATRLADGVQRLVIDPAAADVLAGAVRRCLASGQSGMAQVEAQDWFLHLHLPSPRMMVVGAVHIAQSLVPMARLLGADVTVCDPRARFATADRFPGAALQVMWPDEAIRAAAPDAQSAVVVLSHDPKIDDPALEAALATPCGYVGALGSRRSHAARLARLAERGVAVAAQARILGPIGLEIGAVGASEIAIAILAEWIALRRGAPGRVRSPA